MEKWRCTACGYIYDPEEGDIRQDVDPGTDFEDLPEDWTCPECGASPDEFELHEEEEGYGQEYDEAYNEEGI